MSVNISTEYLDILIATIHVSVKILAFIISERYLIVPLSIYMLKKIKRICETSVTYDAPMNV